MVFRRGEEIVLRKRKTLLDLAGTLPDLGLSPEEMIEKALEEATLALAPQTLMFQIPVDLLHRRIPEK